MRIFTNRQYQAERDRIRYEYDEEKQVMWRIEQAENHISQLRNQLDELKYRISQASYSATRRTGDDNGNKTD